ncbi:MAG: alpha/beta fold hydrolase, partial [Proteobacteria bacterium]|nr:alpha/beta fold hydrolase [Pseudomonadota bacterium]
AGVERQRTDGVDAVTYWTRPARQGALPLVGVHGFGGDKETWLMLAALTRRARGLALVDLPGHGESADVPIDRASIRHHAEAVVRVMDRCGFARAVICGNSMGGGVALRLAASFPDRVAGLVLVASVGPDVHDSALAWTGDVNPLIPRAEDIDQFMALVLERPPPVGRAVIRHVIVERVRRAPQLTKLFHGFVHARGEAGVPHELEAIAHRTLVVHGEQDRIIDRRVTDSLVAGLPRAELVVMRGVGHSPQLEAPRVMARLVDDFARRLEVGERGERDPQKRR